MEDKSAKILLDVPVEDGVLGFDNYRDALNSIIKSSDPHFTIGIFGGWGTGKTTLMKMMKKQLDDKGEVTVWFNPWQYEKENHLLIPLLQTIKLELETNHKEVVGEETLEKLKSILKAVGKNIKPELNIGIAKVGIEVEKGEEDIASLYFKLNQELKNVADRIKQKDKSRIVVFIDDLDRCLPDKALQVLESIKGFLDMHGYVFVLGLSREIIEKCVDVKYGDESGITGSQYLRKMIQVPFTLPDLRDEEIKEYVQNLKKEIKGSEVEKHVADYFDIIVEGLEPNPREIKRFINNFILANRISEKETEPNKLLAVLIMQFRWEEFYRNLAKYKKPFLEETAVIVRSKEALKKEETRKTAKESWIFFDLIEGHLKDELFRNFLEGAGKILFEIQDLDPYIHFSKSVVLVSGDTRKEPSRQELIDLLKTGKVMEFNSARPYPQVDLSNADLTGAILSGVNLSGASLARANLWRANLAGANLVRAGLQYAVAVDCDLPLADLSGADLSLATLDRADLTKASLWEAFLDNTYLGNAKLVGADLRGAHLRGADLREADLEHIIVDENTAFDGTIIQNVKNLSPAVEKMLHIEAVYDLKKATSKWLLEKQKSGEEM